MLYPIIKILINTMVRVKKIKGYFSIPRQATLNHLPSGAKATLKVPTEAVYIFTRIKFSLGNNFIKILYFDRGN